jgi:hypothetical protein
MRALCGAIIAAGALIGLGLAAVGFGYRYQSLPTKIDEQGNIVHHHMAEIGTPLLFILIFLTIAAVIGLGIAFVGLAYHHHRRHHEQLHRTASGGPREQVTV